MHWKHSRYQIVNVILANCHTYDEAYRVLKELEEDYILSIDTALVESKRAEAKLDQSKELIEKSKNEKDLFTRFEVIRAEADIMEIRARAKVAQSCVDVCRDTLEFIQKLITIVNPKRTWKDYPDAQAHQMAQALEWRLDLTWKAYSMICATGNISYDHFINIKMLPDNSKITQLIESLIADVRNGKHGEILKLTKQDVFQHVVGENDRFIEDKLQTLLGCDNAFFLESPEQC